MNDNTSPSSVLKPVYRIDPRDIIADVLGFTSPRAEHNFGDPIRSNRPESKELRRALAKQRKKLRRALITHLVHFRHRDVKIQYGHQDQTNRPAPSESAEASGPGAESHT